MRGLRPGLLRQVLAPGAEARRYYYYYYSWRWRWRRRAAAIGRFQARPRPCGGGGGGTGGLGTGSLGGLVGTGVAVAGTDGVHAASAYRGRRVRVFAGYLAVALFSFLALWFESFFFLYGYHVCFELARLIEVNDIRRMDITVLVYAEYHVTRTINKRIIMPSNPLSSALYLHPKNTERGTDNDQCFSESAICSADSIPVRRTIMHVVIILIHRFGSLRLIYLSICLSIYLSSRLYAPRQEVCSVE